MSSWSLYWILQLDSINRAFALLATFSGVAATVLGIIGAVMRSDEHNKETPAYLAGVTLHRWAARIAALFVFPFLANTFLPSTKQMAAIVIVPAIVNNEKLQHEAGELYTLAKQALVKAVSDNKPTQSDKGKDDADQSQ